MRTSTQLWWIGLGHTTRASEASAMGKCFVVAGGRGTWGVAAAAATPHGVEREVVQAAHGTAREVLPRRTWCLAAQKPPLCPGLGRGAGPERTPQCSGGSPMAGGACTLRGSRRPTKPEESTGLCICT